MSRTRIAISLALLGLLALVGCSKRFVIKPPAPSSVVYASKVSQPAEISVRDARGEGDRPVSTGTLKAALDGIDGREMDFIAEHLQSELRARGIDTERGEGGGGLELDVLKFRIRNQRTSGYSPYWTFTTFSADLSSGGSTHRVTAYFKNGKVPVWAFREVEEPTYNIPTSLVIKELATKVNGRAFGVEASRDEVDRIRAEVDSHEPKLRYLKVFELGYTNNSAAIPHLVELADHEDAMVRSAAISSLGMLRADGEFERLKGYFQERSKLEKLMALKSIGDLETPASRAYLEEVGASKDARNNEIRELLDLYL